MTDPGKTDGNSKDNVFEKMAFVFVDGLRFQKTSYGLVYSPEYQKEFRKHYCSDCMTCAWCSDPRCSLCRDEKLSKKDKIGFPIVR